MVKPVFVTPGPSVEYCACQDDAGNYYYCEEDVFEKDAFLVALQVMQMPGGCQGARDVGLRRFT